MIDPLSHPGSGGEYVVQDGFGWTNGVILDLLMHYGDRLFIDDCTKDSTSSNVYASTKSSSVDSSTKSNNVDSSTKSNNVDPSTESSNVDSSTKSSNVDSSTTSNDVDASNINLILVLFMGTFVVYFKL